MKNLKKIEAFAKKHPSLEVVTFGEVDYHYARKISNSRFGHMPAGIAYCQTAEDVSACVKFCKTEKVPFRIRSGGHQHEGMSTASDVLVIDLSRMFGAKIDYVDRSKMDKAWIPSGMKLEVVYNKLAEDGKVIPGGGCQSVNVGGLTQGGGWGTYIRRFGLTCDSVLHVELVNAEGKIINTATDQHMSDKDKQELLWAIRGGGGGNFGIVTRFLFQISDLPKYQTTFSISWTSDEETVKTAIRNWVEMHRAKKLTRDLSCTASLSIVKDPKGKQSCDAAVVARVGGRFFGKADELLPILENWFKDILPLVGNKDKSGKSVPLMKDELTGSLNYFNSWNERKLSQNVKKPNRGLTAKKLSKNDLAANNDFQGPDIAAENQYLADFMTGMDIAEVTVPGLVDSTNTLQDKCSRPFTVLPGAPPITCDAPHPHKVTSAYPASQASDDQLINDIYDQLNQSKFFPDVRKYMVWHCLGGRMADKTLKKDSCFAFRDKPYLLQLQCWWNNSGKLDNDAPRSAEYVRWIDDFRKQLEESALLEGAFINFVDKALVADPTTAQGRYDLLQFYYGDNLDRLIKAKKRFDRDNLFSFQMSIPTEQPKRSTKRKGC